MKLRLSISLSSFLFLICIGLSSTVWAQLLPDRDYSGDLDSRLKLSGDWGGTRNDWSKKGFEVDISSVATYQNLFSGGIDEDEGLLGSTNFVFFLDTHKAGLWPGGLIKLGAQARYGEIVGGVGSLSPVNNDALLPNEVDHIGETVFGLTELTFTQYLSDKIGVFGGLLDVSSGDNNPFAGNSGSNDHFMNLALSVSLVEFATVPNVTLGAGLIFLPNKNILGSISVLDSEESALNDPFDTNDGTTIATEWHFKTMLGGLPGEQVLGFLYGFNRDYTLIASDFRTALQSSIAGTPLPSRDDSWAYYYNAHQYFKWENDRGWGLFARFGKSDAEVNAIDWNFAVGVGGKGIFTSRPNDTFGLGYYHIEVSDAPILRLLDLGNEDGIEAWYNIAVRPWLHVTADLQVIDTSLGQPFSTLIPHFSNGGLGALPSSHSGESDTAWVAGLRMKVDF
jgi:porin